MIVDDVQLQKKSVNLFEPVWFNLEDRPQLSRENQVDASNEPAFSSGDANQPA